MIIRKLFKAEIAHRLTSAYTKRCTGLHGHSYKIELFLHGDTIDEHQMVMDFKLLKEKMESFLDAFDHSLLISDQDSFLCEVAERLNPRYIIAPYNPTAEMMASHIYLHGKNIGLDIVKVIVHETDGGCAICESSEGFEVALEKVIFSEAIKKGLR